MSFCDPFGFLAYNPQDLIPDGYIFPILNKELTNPPRNLSSPSKGISYVIERDEEGETTKVIEKRKQLPSSGLSMEVLVGRRASSSGGSLFSPGQSFGTPLTTVIGGPLTSGLITGGLATSVSEVSFQLLEAETKINMPISITEEIYNTGLIELPFWPLSIFAIVKEQKEINEKGEEIEVGGIQFTEEELNRLGGTQGNPFFRINGSTDSLGQFGERQETRVEPPPKFGSEEASNLDTNKTNIFLEILRDPRLFKFRADNRDASGKRHMPFKVTDTRRDATSKIIRINKEALSEKDIGKNLYATINITRRRNIRELIRHRGDVFNTPTPAGIGTSEFLPIGYKIDAWNYQLCKWVVPKNIPDVNSLDRDYKILIDQFPQFNDNLTLEERLNNNTIETIEGWRLSEAITLQTTDFWAADYRGILRVVVNTTQSDPNKLLGIGANGTLDEPFIQVVFPVSDFDPSSSDWFLEYLKNLSFTTPTGAPDPDDPVNADNSPKFTYTKKDLEVKIDDYIDLSDLSGVLYDISEINNTFLFDREKIPYYRPFALALNNLNEKIGIINLDLYNNNVLVSSEFDLSKAFFKITPMSSILPTNTSFKIIGGFEGGSCSSLRDTGAYFAPNNQTLGLFVPEGFEISSFWKIQTPFFLDKFNTKTRIFIERFGGDSISDFSSVYSRSLPILEGSISLDFTPFKRQAYLAFQDVKLTNAIAYHIFPRAFYEKERGKLKYDTNQTHNKKEFDHKFYKNIGYNRLIGTNPSYSEGVPVSLERFYIQNNSNNSSFNDIFEKIDLLSYSSLDIVDLPYNDINILSKYWIKNIELEYYIKDQKKIIENDQKISLFFKETDSVINNILLSTDLGLNKSKKSKTIETGYYRGNPIEFNGEILKNITITSMKAIVTEESKIDDFLIKGKQISLIITELNIFCIFYAENNNISIAISYDEGRSWLRHQGIIRLSEGETASLPYCLSFSSGNIIHLYYILNSSYLMYRPLNIDDLYYEDAFIDYSPPPSNSFLVDYDDNLGLEEYTDNGKKVRKQKSYFIDGNSNSNYFKTEINISNMRLKNNKKNKKTIRFSFFGNKNEMNENFEDSRFAIYKDNQGALKLFIIRNNKLYIKVGSTYFNFNYVAKDVKFHRNVFPINKNELLADQNSDNLEIRNIQTVYNSETDTVSIFYFHNEMMFVRHLPNSLINAEIDSEGKLLNEDLLDFLDIKGVYNDDTGEFLGFEDQQKLPIFIVGRLSFEIRQKQKAIQEAISNNISPKNLFKDSRLAIIIPYSIDELDTFDGDSDVNSETQPFGFFNDKGYIRLFYADSNDSIQGLALNARTVPTLDFKLINITKE